MSQSQNSSSTYNPVSFCHPNLRVSPMRLQLQCVKVPARFVAPLISLGLILALFIPATAPRAEDDSAHLQARKKTAPYYQDAQICRSRSKLDPLPEGADPATTIDDEKYIVCINQMGYHQETKTDPFLVAIHRCRNQTTRAVSANGEVHHHSPSQAQVRACLSTRGFPSAGAPPNPNAPIAVTSGHNDSPHAPRPVPPTPKSQGLSPNEGQIETVIIPPRSR